MLALRPMGETLIMPFLYMYSELAFVCVAALSVSLFLLRAGMLAQQFSTPYHQLKSIPKIGLSQSIPEFNKRPRLNGTLDIRNISQTKIH